MNDLSKRLRKMAERDDRRDLLGVIPGILREAADALDARWQTMESAPMNTLVLAWFEGSEFHSGTHWRRSGFGLYAQNSAGPVEHHVRRAAEHIMGSGVHAARWHPLPPPPEDV